MCNILFLVLSCIYIAAAVPVDQCEPDDSCLSESALAEVKTVQRKLSEDFEPYFKDLKVTGRLHVEGFKLIVKYFSYLRTYHTCVYTPVCWDAYLDSRLEALLRWTSNQNYKGSRITNSETVYGFWLIPQSFQLGLIAQGGGR